MDSGIAAEQQESSFHDRAHRLLASKTSLIWVVTWEEARLETQLGRLADHTFKKPIPLLVWSATTGLVDRRDNQVFAGTESPRSALDAVLRIETTVIVLLEDLHPFLTDPLVVRRLREVSRSLDAGYSSIFVSAPDLHVPRDLEKAVAVLELELPGPEELGSVLQRQLDGSPGTHLAEPELGSALVRAAAGLTEDEARRAFARLLLNKTEVTAENLSEIYEEKRQIIRKSGILDFVPPRGGLDQVGGLANLKKWLQMRKRFFGRQARNAGITMPKGVLLTGVSGCGKSLSVQAISSFWQLPMVRLDMNRVYGAPGGPEEGLQRAIETAEAVSPCILWIDEIETAIVGMSGDPTGLATRIFSSFLTWMQEKTKIVFVAATANEIHMLPPELLRKGRFDEIFFVDLPSEQERTDIFTVHLRKRGHHPEDFPIVNLAKSTGNFTGAEIENVVVSALYRAFGEDRSPDGDDLYWAVGQTIPLATTMAEKIKEIRRWADQRAIRAS
ncbi:MAG: AAA family ATPase [Deltaproteobacteria bacterium]|nr:AAA family ATPase [Deltaproteobacteria bacterium]